MSSIGIVCAMSEEVQKIIDAFNLNKTRSTLNYPTYQNNHIVLIESSIGKVASSLATSTLIEKYQVERLINIGLAGALKSIPTGSAYFISSVTQHDAFIPFEDYQKDMYKSIECVVPNNANNTAVLTTGDQFITDNSSVSNGADMVDMEGFAVAYVAEKHHIPITMIKGISDDTNDSSEKALFENLNIAMDQTITLLKSVIEA